MNYLTEHKYLQKGQQEQQGETVKTNWGLHW